MTEISSTPLVSYARWPQVLGLLTALLFALEASPACCWPSTTTRPATAPTRAPPRIVRDVPLGWFVHQMHDWGAYLLIAVVVLRVLRLFWDRLYQAPREVLWLSAVLLMWVVLQLDFTGRLLPYDVKSYWSAMRGLEIVCSQPVVGPFISFVLGGHVISENVLLRCYVLHVVVLPLVLPRRHLPDVRDHAPGRLPRLGRGRRRHQAHDLAQAHAGLHHLPAAAVRGARDARDAAALPVPRARRSLLDAPRARGRRGTCSRPT